MSGALRIAVDIGGTFTDLAAFDQETGQLVGPADVVSRGFVYVREAGELMDFVKQKVEQQFAEAFFGGRTLRKLFVDLDSLGELLIVLEVRRQFE